MSETGETGPELGDPHLAIVRDALAGQRSTIRLLVVAVLFGQTVTAILSGAGLAAELGVFRVYSTDDKRNVSAAEVGEWGELGELGDDGPIEPPD